MKTSDVIQFFGSKSKLADALGVSRQAVTNWGDDVPLLRQYQVKALTKGRFDVDAKAMDES